MLQLFNEINCRKLSLGQVNVFQDFFNNWMFQFIFISTFLVQMCLVQFGGKYLKCTPLSVEEHAVCIGIGAAGLLFGIIVRAAFKAYRTKGFYSAKKREEYEEGLGLMAEENE
jgi:Ca2+ transporting ATPase